jgi:hypothetical protein
VLILLALTAAACGGDGRGSQYDKIMRVAVGSPPPQNSDIDYYWRNGGFARVSPGTKYVPPAHFYPYHPDDTPESVCANAASDAPSPWVGNAFYCPLDRSISWDEEWLRSGSLELTQHEELVSNAKIVPLVVMAHEWGHHIQALTPTSSASASSASAHSASASSAPWRGLGIQQELQADCYTGLYFEYADSRSTAIKIDGGDIIQGARTLYVLGNWEFNDSDWFDPDEHGRPMERWSAFTSGYVTGDSEYCRAYSTYERREDLPLSEYYSVTLPAAVKSYEERISPTGAPMKTLLSEEYNDFTAEIAPQSTTRGVSAEDQIQTIAQTWLGTGTFEWVGEVEPFDVAGSLGGTGAIQYYEQAFFNQQGVQETAHGVVFLHAGQEGEGLLIDVYAPGPAPTDWEPVSDPLTKYLVVLLLGLQNE